MNVGDQVRVIQHVAVDSQLDKTGEVRYVATASKMAIVAMAGQKDRFDPKKPKCVLFMNEDLEVL